MNELKENNWWYERTYNQLIERGKLRGLDKSKLEGYYEKHHIIPKCIGGKNNKENLVLLTAKEHLLAHMILFRLNPSNKLLLMSVNAMLSPGHKPTDETRKRISDNSKNKVKVIDPNGVIYDSINSCSKNYGVDRSTLRKWIKKRPEKGFKYYLG